MCNGSSEKWIPRFDFRGGFPLMTAAAPPTTEQICINTLRTLAMDAVEKAKSGHAGAPMGAAPMAYVLWTRFLKHNPADPHWFDRDRFVLSAGHASMLLYSLLHLSGYDLPLEELERFRQWGSKTPGHPEYRHTPGVELTTGPLGAGFAMSVGIAIAEKTLAARFNRPGHTVIDHHTYGICSDGDLMEGVASEAASLAGRLGLGKLIFLYDDNSITIEGSTALAFTEDTGKRFEAYGWQVLRIDGEDVAAVEAALVAARADSGRPSLIMARTVIAHGSPNKAGTAAAHSNPLGAAELRLTKEALGWPLEPTFYVPGEALSVYRKAVPEGHAAQAAWNARMDAYALEFPAEAATLRSLVAGTLPTGWESALPVFSAAGGAMATRAASGKTLAALAPVLDGLVGGSGDLAPSTNTFLKEYGALGVDGWDGRNLHFGVREHAMASAVNGMALHGGLIPYSGTFMVFSDYMRPAIRLGAIMQTHAIFVFTHDSIGVGEDGPTHQPVEQLASLRAMPGLRVVRPGDANETSAAWKLAIESPGPTAMVLSRQDVPTLDDVERIHAGVARGAYVLSDPPSGEPEVALLATGSEVGLALAARDLLVADGIPTRVVSMPCWEVFEAQDRHYRETVLPHALRARVAVEAGATFGWERYTGEAGAVVGLDHFGASAPAPTLFEKFGFTPAAVAERARDVLRRLAQAAP